MLIAFLLQQWLHKRVSVLPYMYSACLVKCCICQKHYFHHSGNLVEQNAGGLCIVNGSACLLCY